MKYRLLIFPALVLVMTGCMTPAMKEESEIDRGRELVMEMDCNNCHTPDYDLQPNVPEEDWLTGGNLGFTGPNGTVYPANLRLMISQMSEDEWLKIAKKLREGMPMEAVLLPNLPESDLIAIYRFVKHLGPKGYPAPEPLPPGEIPQTRYIDFPYIH